MKKRQWTKNEDLVLVESRVARVPYKVVAKKLRRSVPACYSQHSRLTKDWMPKKVQLVPKKAPALPKWLVVDPLTGEIIARADIRPVIVQY